MTGFGAGKQDCERQHQEYVMKLSIHRRVFTQKPLTRNISVYWCLFSLCDFCIDYKVA